MPKRKSSLKPLIIGVLSIVGLAALYVTNLSAEKAERIEHADFNCPTLGVNTLQYNGNLVVVSTDKASRRYGLRVGDLITSVEGKPMVQISDLIKATESLEKGDRVCMLVEREEQAVSIRRKFRGAIRGDNGERLVDDAVKAVGHHAQFAKSKSKKKKSDLRRQPGRKSTSMARMRTH